MSSEEISKHNIQFIEYQIDAVMNPVLDIVIDHEFVSYLTKQFTIRIRQSYKILSLSRAVFCYQPDRQRDERVNQWTQDGAACGRFSISTDAMP